VKTISVISKAKTKELTNTGGQTAAGKHEMCQKHKEKKKK
jgi:hypothetical protein